MNHCRPRSQVPAFRCSRAQRGRSIRVSSLYKVFPVPGASWTAPLLDNYPQEYQKSSSKHDNKPTNAPSFSTELRLNCVFPVAPSSHSQPFALTSVAPQSESVRRSPEGARVQVDRQQEGHGNRTQGQRQHELEEKPKRSPESCTQQQQRAADAQAVKTWGRNRDKECCKIVQLC